VAHELYERVARLPIVSPHGHVEARLFADQQARFGSPASTFVTGIIVPVDGGFSAFSGV
jgi:glucuronate isomerase